MVNQGIQKHNPDSIDIDEGYNTRTSSPIHLKNENIDESEGGDTLNVSYKTFPEYEDMDEDTLNVSYKTFPEYEDMDEDTLNVSYKTFPEYEDMDEDALSVLYETCQSEQDLEVMGTFQPDIAIYKQVDECVRKNTLSTLLNTRCQTNTSHLDSDETVEEGMIKGLLELIALGQDKNIMFGMPCDVFHENTSLMDFLMHNLYILKAQELSTCEKHQLDILSSKISDLVSTGTYMSEEALKFLPPDLLEKRNNYLSNLKQIVCDSIENDKKDGVILERDNKFYYVQCPEESVITPAKFLSNPEFQNLDGALKIGEGDDVIRIQDGKYHDMKGRLQMTFPISNSEKIVMTLSSEKVDKPENASSFGKIMVHMDDKSCGIFSKYLKELEKEPRISKVVEAAKSFVEEKKGKQSKPFSVLEEVGVFKRANCGYRSLG